MMRIPTETADLSYWELTESRLIVGKPAWDLTRWVTVVWLGQSVGSLAEGTVFIPSA